MPMQVEDVQVIRRDRLLNLIMECLNKEDIQRRFYYFIFICEQLEDTEKQLIPNFDKVYKRVEIALKDIELYFKYQLYHKILTSMDEGRVLLDNKYNDKEIYDLEYYREMIKQMIYLDYDVHITLGKALKLMSKEAEMNLQF